MVSTGSFVIVGSREFHIPEILYLEPENTWDDRDLVHRISLGNPNMTAEDEAFYKPLFAALDTYLKETNEGFVTDVMFQSEGNTLKFSMAYVSKLVKDYGLFYDIEAMYGDAKYKKETHEQTKD